MPSLLLWPLSEALCRVGADGASGAMPSTSTAAVLPTELSVSTASLPATSFSVPPFKESIPTVMPFVSSHPAWTVVLNCSAEEPEPEM